MAVPRVIGAAWRRKAPRRGSRRGIGIGTIEPRIVDRRSTKEANDRAHETAERESTQAHVRPQDEHRDERDGRRGDRRHRDCAKSALCLANGVQDRRNRRHERKRGECVQEAHCFVMCGHAQPWAGNRHREVGELDQNDPDCEARGACPQHHVPCESLGVPGIGGLDVHRYQGASGAGRNGSSKRHRDHERDQERVQVARDPDRRRKIELAREIEELRDDGPAGQDCGRSADGQQREWGRPFRRHSRTDWSLCCSVPWCCRYHVTVLAIPSRKGTITS